MTIGDWLHDSERALADAGIETPRLDAQVLLSDQLGKDKAWLLAYSDTILQGSDLKLLNKNIIQRCKHIPLAYIRGHTEYYGRPFSVNEHVLVPRPETECMVDVLKQIVAPEKFATVIDIGTGSGMLAITAKLELPNTEVIALDVDEHCVATAEQNATMLGADVRFMQGDLLQPLDSVELRSPCILLCNLPYVPDDYPINKAAQYEPKLALYSGSDGLDHYRRLFGQFASTPTSPEFVITESLPMQHEPLSNLANQHGYKEIVTEGLVQLFAVVK